MSTFILFERHDALDRNAFVRLPVHEVRKSGGRITLLGRGINQSIGVAGLRLPCKYKNEAEHPRIFLAQFLQS